MKSKFQSKIAKFGDRKIIEVPKCIRQFFLVGQQVVVSDKREKKCQQ